MQRAVFRPRKAEVLHMRFVIRSAFWLIVAFVVIRPGIDINAAAGSLTGEALKAGQQAIAAQIDKTECNTLQCAGGKALLAAALTNPNPALTPMQAIASEPAPQPRPRPAWLG
jgi:hypothetical protein